MSTKKTSGKQDKEFPQLARHGLLVRTIEGDGNCLFSALSDQLYGHTGQAATIRANVVQWESEHPDVIKPSIAVFTGGGSRRAPARKTRAQAAIALGPTEDEQEIAWQNHLKNMAQDGTWGDQPEIVAFSAAYNVHVDVWLAPDGSNPVESYSSTAATVAAGQPQINIAYHTWQHYSTVHPIGRPFNGVFTDAGIGENLPAPQPIAVAAPGVQKATPILDWQVNLLLTSLPHTIDEFTIRQTLQECHGDIDESFERLVNRDDDYSSSQSAGTTTAHRSPAKSASRSPKASRPASRENSPAGGRISKAGKRKAGARGKKAAAAGNSKKLAAKMQKGVAEKLAATTLVVDQATPPPGPSGEGSRQYERKSWSSEDVEESPAAQPRVTPSVVAPPFEQHVSQPMARSDSLASSASSTPPVMAYAIKTLYI